MPITISGDSPNFTSVAATTVNGVTTLNSSSGVLATQNGMTGIAKAWVNFNGSTGAVNSSFNVSSITRNTTGTYTINFTTAMPNATYAPVLTSRNGSIAGISLGTLATSSFQMITSNTAGTLVDAADNGVAVFSS